MEYDVLQGILKPDRLLDLWEADEAERTRRIPIVRATQVNDAVETILEHPEYIIRRGVLTFQKL